MGEATVVWILAVVGSHSVIEHEIYEVNNINNVFWFYLNCMQLDLGVLFIKLKIWGMGTSKIPVYFALLDEANWAFICFGDFHRISSDKCCEVFMYSSFYLLRLTCEKKSCFKVQFHMLIYLFNFVFWGHLNAKLF